MCSWIADKQKKGALGDEKLKSGGKGNRDSLVGNCSSTEEALCLLHIIDFVSFRQDGCDQEENASDEGGTFKKVFGHL